MLCIHKICDTSAKRLYKSVNHVMAHLCHMQDMDRAIHVFLAFISSVFLLVLLSWSPSARHFWAFEAEVSQSCKSSALSACKKSHGHSKRGLVTSDLSSWEFWVGSTRQYVNALKGIWNTAQPVGFLRGDLRTSFLLLIHYLYPSQGEY